MEVVTFWVVGSLHAVRALDVWFLRSVACVTGEKAAREAECLVFFLFLWIHDERSDFVSTMPMQL